MHSNFQKNCKDEQRLISELMWPCSLTKRALIRKCYAKTNNLYFSIMLKTDLICNTYSQRPTFTTVLQILNHMLSAAKYTTL